MKMMTKTSEITGYHIKLLMWFLTTIAVVFIGLISYIWQDQRIQTAKADIALQKSVDQMIGLINKNADDISEMKKEFLKNGVDIDERTSNKRLQNMINEYNSNHKNVRRGIEFHKLNINFIPDTTFITKKW